MTTNKTLASVREELKKEIIRDMKDDFDMNLSFTNYDKVRLNYLNLGAKLQRLEDLGEFLDKSGEDKIIKWLVEEIAKLKAELGK